MRLYCIMMGRNATPETFIEEHVRNQTAWSNRDRKPCIESTQSLEVRENVLANITPGARNCQQLSSSHATLNQDDAHSTQVCPFTFSAQSQRPFANTLNENHVVYIVPCSYHASSSFRRNSMPEVRHSHRLTDPRHVTSQAIIEIARYGFQRLLSCECGGLHGYGLVVIVGRLYVVHVVRCCSRIPAVRGAFAVPGRTMWIRRQRVQPPRERIGK